MAGDGGGSVYRETAGTGPAVVLTHDGLLHRETWDEQFTAFARHYRVTRWDRRGYGRSAPPHAPYSSVADLASVVRSVSDGPATLVGCSFGSLLSLHCALDHPQLVAALVLVGPIVSGLGFSEHFLTRGGRGVPPADAPVAQEIDYWSRTDPWLVARQHRGAAAAPGAAHGQPPQPVATGRPGAATGALRAGAARAAGGPTLIVVGEGDIPDVHAHSGAIQAGIPGARRVVLAGSGHLPHLEVPDAFNRVVLEFVDAQVNR